MMGEGNPQQLVPQSPLYFGNSDGVSGQIGMLDYYGGGGWISRTEPLLELIFCMKPRIYRGMMNPCSLYMM